MSSTVSSSAPSTPTPEFDPYALPPEAIETPPATLALAMRKIGPGLILAGAIVGTGELIATTHLGAKVGFALLWLVIVSCFIKVFVQAELARYATTTGQTTHEAFRGVPGGVVISWCWFVMILCSQLQLGAMVGSVGQALHMAMPGVSPAIGRLFSSSYITGHPELPWAVLAAVGTSSVLAVGGYALVEWGTTVLVAIFTFMTVGCVAMLPAAGHPIPWSSIADGLKFTIPNTDGALAAAFAMFGITGVGAAELVYYPYWCIEKGYARKVGPRDDSPQWLSRAKGWIRVMLADVFVCMLVYTVATLAFYILGAATLHESTGKGLPGTVGQMLETLAKMYAPVLGETAALWFIVIGVFAVLYSTLYAATASNCRAMVDFLHVDCGLKFRAPGSRREWVRWFCVVFPILDLVLFMTFKNPVKMVITAGIIQAVTLPLLAGAAVYLRYRRTDRRLVSGRVWDAFLWLSSLGLLAAAGYGLWDSYSKMGK